MLITLLNKKIREADSCHIYMVIRKFHKYIKTITEQQLFNIAKK